MSASERTKGAQGEREAIGIIRRHGWPDAERSARGIEQRNGDVQNGPAAYHIEIKRQERLNIPKAFDQVASRARPTDVPLLIHRPSRHEWMATLPLEELLALVALQQRG